MMFLFKKVTFAVFVLLLPIISWASATLCSRVSFYTFDQKHHKLYLTADLDQHDVFLSHPQGLFVQHLTPEQFWELRLTSPTPVDENPHQPAWFNIFPVASAYLKSYESGHSVPLFLSLSDDAYHHARLVLYPAMLGSYANKNARFDISLAQKAGFFQLTLRNTGLYVVVEDKKITLTRRPESFVGWVINDMKSKKDCSGALEAHIKKIPWHPVY